MEETVIWVAGLVVEVLLVATIVLAMLLRRARRTQRQLLAQLAERKEQPAQDVTATQTAAEVLEQTFPEEPTETPEPASPEIETPQAESAAIEPTVLEPTVIEPTLIEPNAEAFGEVEVAAALPTEEPPREEPMIEAPLPQTTTPAIETLEVEFSDGEPGLPRAADLSLATEFDQLMVGIDSAKLNESVERLQQRMDATTRSLQRFASADGEQSRPEVASLQLNLKEMSEDVDLLQHSNAQLQHDLQRRTQAMERAASKAHDNMEMVLQHAQKLRGDIATLRDKLQNSDSDVQRLQTEKEALAAEYEALNKEYEQIYSHGKR